MRKVFGAATLEAFEDASASIVVRGIDRAFERAGIALGPDVADEGGARRVRFRRYVGNVDQRDPGDRDRLGAALGAIVGEVATSKIDYLVSTAERDGFVFVDRVFRIADTSRTAFTIARVEDFASVDDCERRLRLLAGERPHEAVAGALALIDSTCRLVVGATRAPGLAGERLGELTAAALASLDESAAALAGDLARSADVVARLGERRDDVLDARHARLAIGMAVTIVRYLSESYATVRAD